MNETIISDPDIRDSQRTGDDLLARIDELTDARYSTAEAGWRAVLWACRAEILKLTSYLVESKLKVTFMRLREMQEQERMMKWFEYSHLPERLHAMSKPFGDLAREIADNVQPGPERTVALRKLLEAKDAAVRAVVSPGG